MKDTNVQLLIRIRSAMDELPVRTYQECNIKLGILQAIDQIISEEGDTEKHEDENQQ